MPCRVMGLGQIVALVMVNKHMKFHKICDNDNDNDNDYAAANAEDDTRVMTIPRLFSLKNSRAKNVYCRGQSATYIVGPDQTPRITRGV